MPSSVSSKSNREVQILQAWDGYRPYYRQLADSLLADLKKKKKNDYKNNKNNNFGDDSSSSNNNNIVAWIEWPLETPLADYRKLIVDLI